MSDHHSLPIRWRWFAVTFALTFPTLVTLVYFVWLSGHASWLQQGAYGVGKTLQFGFPLAWMFFAERRRLKVVPPNLVHLASGAGLGLLILAGMAGLYYGWLKGGGISPEAVEAIRQKLLETGTSTPLRFAVLGVFYSLAHSLLEEYYWRWFVFGRLRELVTFPAAAVVSALGFTAHHVFVLAHYFGWDSFLTWGGSLSITIGGVLWAGMYARQNSLWGVWLSHLLVDAGIFLAGYDLAVAVR